MKEEKIRNVGPSHIEIVFECLGKPSSPPLFLIMGGGAQLISWPDGFCELLVKKGLQVIRFDNRDAGLSTHFTDAPVPDLAAALSGDFTSVSYTLSDMAADTIGLMESLGFESAHIAGASLGGMIAQTMVIEHPSKVRSLTAIMSTTGDLSVGQPDFKVLSNIGQLPYNDRQAYMEWRVRALITIGSPKYPFDEETTAKSAGRSWGRDHDPLGMLRQSAAALKSGDRTGALHNVKIPTLVIHGDSDNMINVSGGKATAKAITGSELYIFEGMGHGFPKPLWPQITTLIADHIQRSESFNS